MEGGDKITLGAKLQCHSLADKENKKA